MCWCSCRYKQNFPGGGFLNSKHGDGSRQVSVDEFTKMAGVSGGAQYGKK